MSEPIYTPHFVNFPIKPHDLARFWPRLRVYMVTQKKCVVPVAAPGAMGATGYAD